MAGTLVVVTVYPNSGKEVLVQTGPGRYDAWVKAAPLQGQANSAAAGLLKRHLQAGTVRLVKGHRSRKKLFVVA